LVSNKQKCPQAEIFCEGEYSTVCASFSSGLTFVALSWQYCPDHYARWSPLTTDINKSINRTIQSEHTYAANGGSQYCRSVVGDSVLQSR
jgi:hypothetical protein